jgi:hypothetical protein
VRASVRFARFERNRTNRKKLAQQLHPEVLKLKEGCEEANLKAGL